MKLTDLKHFNELENSKKVKVLRHKSTNEDLWQLRTDGMFQKYQNNQSWDVFSDANFLISFIAERDCYAKFVGVWKVTGKRKKNTSPGYLYSTKECEGFDELKSRLVVFWGKGTRSWAQWLHRKGDKKISEVLPINYVKDFPGFYDFSLSYRELKKMIANPDSNREWYRMLSSISGVYLILHKRTGQQYVGSAYGKGGIWQRWKSYSRNPTGNNKLMSEHLSKDSNFHDELQFSLLRVLEPSSTKDEVISHETILKRKLGSRAFGLNAN